MPNGEEPQGPWQIQNWLPGLLTMRWGQLRSPSRLNAQGPAGHAPGASESPGACEKQTAGPAPELWLSRSAGARDSAFLRSSRGAGLVRTTLPSTDTQGAWTARDARCPTAGRWLSPRARESPGCAYSRARARHLRPPRGARACSGPGLCVALGCRGAGPRGSLYQKMTSGSP